MGPNFNKPDENEWGSLFDQLKAKEGLSNDSKLAEALGVTRSFICSVRKNRKNVSPELGRKIFQRLGKHVSEGDLEIFMPLRMRRSGGINRTTPQLRSFVLQRANGVCELCGMEAPFVTPQGVPYLEIHLIKPLALGGELTVHNHVALCPNCHRKVVLCPSEETQQILIERAAGKG